MEKLITKKNVLLVKDDVGKPKPPTVKLPGGDHTFGKPDLKDQEGARVITSSWITHKSSKSGAQPKDFRKINKYGLTQPVDVKVSEYMNLICLIESK